MVIEPVSINPPTGRLSRKPWIRLLAVVLACPALLVCALAHATFADPGAGSAASGDSQLMTVDQLQTVLGTTPLTLIKSFTGRNNSRWLYARLRTGPPTVVTHDSITAYANVVRNHAKSVDRQYLEYFERDFQEAQIGANRFAVDLRGKQRWRLNVHPFAVDLDLEPHYRGELIDYWEPAGPGAACGVFRVDQGTFSVRFGLLKGALVRAWTMLTDTETPDFRLARYFLNLNPGYFQVFGVNQNGEPYPLCDLLSQKNSRRVALTALSPDEAALYSRFRAAIETDGKQRSALGSAIEVGAGSAGRGASGTARSAP